VAVDATIAGKWIERWDRQQEYYMPDREERFTALIDAVESAAERHDPLIVDLGCGPGSLGVRLLDRLPKATILGVDADPVTLALGRAVYGERISFADADLRVPGWLPDLKLDRPADAVVSTTALHWLAPAVLGALYTDLAGLLRPGGLFLNGDHFRDESPMLAQLERAIPELEYRRRFPDGHAEKWLDWWDAAAADQDLGPLVAERSKLFPAGGHNHEQSGLLTTHVDALRAAGFAEVGTLWQRGDSRLLCGVR
jgi:SAM-dependent methyltransferase